MTVTLEDLTDTALAGLLEDDYRRQLRWYPKPWRDAHGDALIGTLLDEADDTDRFTMERGEWRSFAAAGLAARLDRVVMRPVRDAAATVLLSAGAGISVVSFVTSSWAPWGSDLSPAFGPFYDAGPILTAMWVVALVSALADRWWVGRVALLASIAVALLMHPAETLLAPAHFFSLNPGTLMLSAAGAFLAVIGTPRVRLPLIAAAVGWAGVGCIAHAYEVFISGRSSDRPTGVLLIDPAATSWAIALALGVAVILALGRYQVAAFTVVSTVVPVTAATVTSQLAYSFNPPATYLLIVAPVAVGLVLLVGESRHRLGRRGAANAVAPGPSGYQRRSKVAVAIVAPLFVLGGTATVLTVAGLNWADPTGVNWSQYWKTTSRPLAELTDPTTELAYRLPSGGSCTIRVRVVDASRGAPPSTATRIARGYLTAATKNGTLLKDARISDVIRQNPSRGNSIGNFWGVPVAYGRGTSNYNADVEYFEAVDADIRQVISRHIEQVGVPPDDIRVDTAQQCIGEQQ